MNQADVIVVGAGIAGLTAAAYCVKQGRKVLLFESAHELGGCASKFDRQGYRFAAGATVGMGFESGGVFQRLFEELEMPLPKYKAMDIIMDVHLPDRTVRYYQNKTAWYQELALAFPRDHTQIIAFYEECFRVSSYMQDFVRANPIFPPSRPRDFGALLQLMNPRLIRLFPFVFETVGKRLRHFGLTENREFMTFLNGQFIDSVQTTAEHCPALLGYMALGVFHQGAFYVHGGLASLAEQLAEGFKKQGGHLFLRSPIQQFRQTSEGWEVETAKNQSYRAKHLILANSLHNLSPLADANLQQHFSSRLKRESHKPTWGAYTLYIGAKDTWIPQIDENPLFHQFIQNYASPLAEGNQFLFSISAPDDLTRAKAQHHAITISTHTDWKQWWNQDQYDQRKHMYAEQIVTAVAHRFPEFPAAIDCQFIGTPVTFRRYTQRQFGKVGGYIPFGPTSLWHSASIRLGVDDLWACGDTVFPGAGTLGVAMSGWRVAQEICQSVRN